MTDKSAFIHVGITVSDLERSVAWYREHFGFIEVRRFEKPGLEIKAAVIQLNGIQFELLQPANPVGRERPVSPLVKELKASGANHIALGVADISRCYETLENSGCTMVTELLGGKMFFCKDPDGTMLEVKQL
ncbi:MAG: hypothetical protein GF350_14220 [Chitinivibrionales bacterium]|nr:hypothetical protein [Chitinivibrionales bacterium]